MQCLGAAIQFHCKYAIQKVAPCSEIQCSTIASAWRRHFGVVLFVVNDSRHCLIDILGQFLVLEVSCEKQAFFAFSQ